MSARRYGREHKDELPEVQALCTQLRELAQRGIGRVFLDLPDQGPKHLPDLFEVVELHRPEDWVSDRMEAIEAVVLDAVDQLPDELIPDTKIKWQWTAYALHDLLANEDEELEIDSFARGRRYDNIVAAVNRKAEYSRSARSASRDITHLVRSELAHILQDFKREALGLNAAAESAPEATKYIERRDLHDQVFVAFKSRKKIVLLHGDAGTGKSTLAEELAGRIWLKLRDDEAIDKLPIIRGRTQDSLEDSLYNTLCEHTDAPSSGSFLVLARQFRSWISGDNAPPVVVLDNIEEVSLLQQLLPPKARSFVMVTSRRRLLDGDHVGDVHVTNMTSAEAHDLVILHAPALDAEQAAVVAEALDYRPLAILHGCSCLPDRPYDGNVPEFLGALGRNIAAVLDSYGREDDVTLVAIYKMVLEQLSGSTDVIDLLDILACLGPYIDIETVLPLLWPSSGANPEQELRPEDQGALEKALRVLEGRNLVRRGSMEIMHGLTAEIIKSLRIEPAIPKVVNSIRCLTIRLDLNSWPGGQPLPQDWPLIAPVLGRLLDIEIADAGNDPSPETDYVFTLILRQYRQSGYIPLSHRHVAQSFVAKSLERGTPPTPLHRETLELGHLQFADIDVNGKPLLDAVREIMPDAFTYEAMFRGDSHPFACDYYTPHLLTLAEYLPPRFRMAGAWANEARLSYAMAIMCLQYSLWDYAEAWLNISLDLYNHFVDDHPEIGILAAENLRRLAEVAIRSGHRKTAAEHIKKAMGLAAEARRLKVHSDQPIDRRILQTTENLIIDDIVRAGNIANITNSDSRSSVATDRFNIIQILANSYSDTLLKWPLLESLFDAWRLIATENPEAAVRGFGDLADVYREYRCGTGARLAELAQLKARLAQHANLSKREIRTIACRTRKLSHRFLHRDQSLFWSADALCVTLAAEMLADQPMGSVKSILATLRKSLARIKRLDKLDRAYQVAFGGASPVILLAI